MTVDNDSLTPGEKVLIQLLGKHEGGAGMRAGMLEDKAEERKVQEPRDALRTLWEKGMIRLFEASGKLWQGRQWFFVVNPPQYPGVVETYSQFRYKLTEKGRDLHGKLPEQEPAAPDAQQKNQYTVFGKTIEFRAGEILCNDKDTGVTKEDSRTVLRKLCEKPDQVVAFKELLPEKQEKEKEAEQPLKDAVTHLRKKLVPFGLRIQNRRGHGYKIIADPAQ
jgi:DNA-binding winged helix-turn-helix (wHTH) protein